MSRHCALVCLLFGAGLTGCRERPPSDGRIANTCPVLDELSASPLAVRVGGVANLSMAAHDSDHGPAPLAYSWSVRGAKLPGQRSRTLRFPCRSVGEATITAAVSDGDPDPTCADRSSVTVSCE